MAQSEMDVKEMHWIFKLMVAKYVQSKLSDRVFVVPLLTIRERDLNTLSAGREVTVA